MDDITLDSHHDKTDRSARGWANTLGTWPLCSKQRCRRAKACQGKGLACLRTHLPLLPDEVQLWFATFMEAHKEGLSFEDARARVEEYTGHEGYVRWRAAIGQPVHVEDE